MWICQYEGLLVFKLFFMTSLSFVISVGNGQSYRYEKLHNYGIGKRVIPNYRLMKAEYQYPEPLPSTPSVYIRSPHRNIYQGVRRKGDRRIYHKRFNYAPKPFGHHVFCEAMVDCKISHMAIETNEGVPILLRGGVGYNYFKVIIKAETGVRLQGSLKAYCRNNDLTIN